MDTGGLEFGFDGCLSLCLDSFFSLPFEPTKVRPTIVLYVHYVDSGPMGTVLEFGSDGDLS